MEIGPRERERETTTLLKTQERIPPRHIQVTKSVLQTSIAALCLTSLILTIVSLTSARWVYGTIPTLGDVFIGLVHYYNCAGGTCVKHGISYLNMVDPNYARGGITAFILFLLGATTLLVSTVWYILSFFGTTNVNDKLDTMERNLGLSIGGSSCVLLGMALMNAAWIVYISLVPRSPYTQYGYSMHLGVIAGALSILAFILDIALIGVKFGRRHSTYSTISE